MIRLFSLVGALFVGLVLAQPVHAAVSVSVPEPSSILLLVTGAIGLGGVGLRRGRRGPKE